MKFKNPYKRSGKKHFVYSQKVADAYKDIIERYWVDDKGHNLILKEGLHIEGNQELNEESAASLLSYRRMVRPDGERLGDFDRRIKRPHEIDREMGWNELEPNPGPHQKKRGR